MDLLTPARTWAPADHAPPADDPEIAAEPRHMPLAQHLTMFLSVVGPIAGLVVAIVLMWHRGPASVGWPELVAMCIMYAIPGFGVTIGFHRLLTHQAFETYRPIKLLLAICGSIGGQGAVIRWCATHRRHHQTSDQDGDPHSPHLHGESAFGLLQGMWHAHMGWLFHRDAKGTAKSVSDLLADPILVRIDQLYFFWVIVGILIPGVVLGLMSGTWHGFVSGMIWGGLVRICLLQHVTWCINSVCHVWGGRPFRTADYSVNNGIFGILAFGEGWHNNHHAFPTSARHGMWWWQFDSSWLIIRAMNVVGLVWNVRTPSQASMEIKRRVAT